MKLKENLNLILLFLTTLLLIALVVVLIFFYFEFINFANYMEKATIEMEQLNQHADNFLQNINKVSEKVDHLFENEST